MQITERALADVMILDLKGKITLGEGDELLKDKVNSLVNQGQRKIVLNLAGVPYLDSAGLGHTRRSRALWSWLFSPAAWCFAREIATYDQIVGSQGLQHGARWLLERFTARLDVVGRAIQVQRDDVVVEVVGRGLGVLGQDAQDAVVVQRPAAIDVDPV